MLPVYESWRPPSPAWQVWPNASSRMPVYVYVLVRSDSSLLLSLFLHTNYHYNNHVGFLFMDTRCMYQLARRIDGITHHIGYSQTSFYADTEIGNGEWQWGTYVEVPQMGWLWRFWDDEFWW